MIKQILFLCTALAISIGVYAQNCLENPRVNAVTFIGASGGNCTYSIDVQVTVSLPSTKRVYFNFVGGNIPSATDICYVGTGPGVFIRDVACNIDGENGGAGNPVIRHIQTVILPCGTTPTVSYAGSRDRGTGGNTCSPGTFNFTGITPTGPLPVSLVSFSVASVETGNLIEWQTASETKSRAFVVQRSLNAVRFTDVHQINTGEDSKEIKNYSFLDNNAVAGTSYYRLKQIDIDGTESLSKIIAASWNTDSESLYPNPVRNQAFTVNGVSGEIRTSSVMDNKGNQVPTSLSKAAENVTFTLTQFTPPGVYYVYIQTTTKSFTKKIVVQ